MAIEKNKLIAIVACIIVIAAAAAAAVVLMNGNGDDSNSLVIEDGKTITQDQLDDLKKKADKDSNVKLTYNAGDYTVVFDSAAIKKIDAVADLAVSKVDIASLGDDVKSVLSEGSQAISISYGDNKDFGTGTVTVTLAKELASGKTGDDLVGLYVDGSKLSVVPVSYSDGKVIMTLSHFSTYVVSYATNLDSAELKVLGNIDGDTRFTSKDVETLESFIAKGVPFELYPLADANNDKVIDSKDVEIVKNIINGDKTTIWHYNYHDSDRNGTMDKELVSTVIPVTSAIATGSANTFMMLYMNGIIDEIKGASYGSTNDTFLYKDNYLNTKNVVKLGSSSSTITFEDGKAGSSDVIAKQNVTLLLSDWNRDYITNEADFEKAGVDVLRIASASTDKEVYTHSIMLLGLVFGKVDRSAEVLDAYNETFDAIDSIVSGISDDKRVKAVASSTDGSLSSADSDYTAFVVRAGAKFGLQGFNFGGSASIKVNDNLGVFDTRTYNYDYIVHIRTALTYANKDSDIGEKWSMYANSMEKWDKAYDGQILVSGSVPVPVRVAYIASAFYGDSYDSLNSEWADGVEKTFAEFYNKSTENASNHKLCLDSYSYSVNFGDDLVVKDKDGNVVQSGDKFAYGTKLSVSPAVAKDSFVLRAYGDKYNGTVENDGSFTVVDNMNMKYIAGSIVDLLNGYSAKFVETYGKGVYGTATVGTMDGSVSLASTYFNGLSQTKTFTYTYFDSVDDAKAKYTDLAKDIGGKDVFELDYSGNDFDGIRIKYTNSIKDGNYTGSTLYLCAIRDNIVVNMVDKYTSAYFMADSDKGKELMAMSADDRSKYYAEGAKAFADALGSVFPARESADPGASDAAEIAKSISEKFSNNSKMQFFNVNEADSAVLTETYVSSRGSEIEIKDVITVMKSADAAEKYEAIADALKAADGQHKAYMSTMYTLFSGEAIDGVEYVALAATSSSAVYLEFVMISGDIVVKCSTEKGGAYFTDANSPQALLNDFASILKA